MKLKRRAGRARVFIVKFVCYACDRRRHCGAVELTESEVNAEVKSSPRRGEAEVKSSPKPIFVAGTRPRLQAL